MNITQLKILMPRAAMAWLIALAEEAPRWGVHNTDREAGLLGQIIVESRGMTVFDESLYYTDAARVRRMFSRYFDPLDVDDAWGYLQQPERFANRVYANRYGNGDESSGDGWAYRGGGPGQLTFRGNYQRIGGLIGADIEARPEQVRTVPVIGCRAFLAYWQAAGCNEFSDRQDFKNVSERVNGGHNGLDERLQATAEVLQVLAA